MCFFLSKKLWKLLSIFAGWSGAVEVHLFLGEFFPRVCVSIELLWCVAWCQCGFITSSPLSFDIRADTSVQMLCLCTLCTLPKSVKKVQIILKTEGFKKTFELNMELL